MKRLIIYDLDGTLIDTKTDLLNAANHMLQALERPVRPGPEVWSYVGKGLRQFVASCVGTDDPEVVEPGMARYRAYYREHLLDHSRLYPGVREVLEHFHARRQAVVTNKPEGFSRTLLTELGVAGYLFAVIAGDSGYPRKPDPGAVRALMTQERIAPEETLLVGDSAVDVETGRRAGVMTVGVAQGFAEDGELMAAKPDLLVRDFAQLLEHAIRHAW